MGRPDPELTTTSAMAQTFVGVEISVHKLLSHCHVFRRYGKMSKFYRTIVYGWEERNYLSILSPELRLMIWELVYATEMKEEELAAEAGYNANRKRISSTAETKAAKKWQQRVELPGFRNGYPYHYTKGTFEERQQFFKRTLSVEIYLTHYSEKAIIYDPRTRQTIGCAAYGGGGFDRQYRSKTVKQIAPKAVSKAKKVINSSLRALNLESEGEIRRHLTLSLAIDPDVKNATCFPEFNIAMAVDDFKTEFEP